MTAMERLEEQLKTLESLRKKDSEGLIVGVKFNSNEEVYVTYK